MVNDFTPNNQPLPLRFASCGRGSVKLERGWPKPRRSLLSAPPAGSATRVRKGWPRSTSFSRSVHNKELPPELLHRLQQQTYWRFYTKPRSLVNLGRKMGSFRNTARAVVRRALNRNDVSVN
jgi:hypothetical protein